MNKVILLLLLISLLSFLKLGYTQDYASNVKGRVSDMDMQFSLPGATLELYKGDSLINSVASDMDGYYFFNNVLIGKYRLVCSYISYNPYQVAEVVVNAGKETVINIELEESSVIIDEVEIMINEKDKTNNELVSVSARAFNNEEAERYPGSRADPARMAANFAGVQGTNDQRNDIVIRGNTPTGVLWRVEGVDIFNPSHFAIAGTNGGPVSMLNNKTFGKSDFFTSAFPSEYGNAISGVFDIQFRNGNRDEHEFTGQFGILGAEISAEGPFSDQKGTYLFAYRYSTLKTFHTLGVPIGTDAVPRYQDLSFKLNYNVGENASISLFGLGGLSKIDIIVSEYKEPTEELYGYLDRDQYFTTNMGVLGVTYKKTISKKMFFKTTLATSGQEIKSHHDLVYRPDFEEGMIWAIDSIIPKLDYKFINLKQTSSTSLTYKPNVRNLLKVGVIGEYMAYNYYDSLYNESTYQFDQRIDFTANSLLFQEFIHWKHKFSEDLVMNLGLHAQHFTLSNSHSIEPRAGLTYQINDRNRIAVGYGKHSQTQPTYFYFQKFANAEGIVDNHNMDMDFTLSDHFVLTYDLKLPKQSRLKTEIYYQYLANIPVASDSTPFSMANFGSVFVQIEPGELVNAGNGRNYGLELTYEKFFSKSFFFLTTLSLFESKYTALDGVERNTAFNGNYVYNILGGKEFKFGEKGNKVLGLGGKFTIAGGKRYTPIDVIASDIINDAVYNISRTNEEQFREYIRLDLKISYRLNTVKLTHEWAVDLINVSDYENIQAQAYVGPKDGASGYIVNVPQLGFLPLFYYKINF